MELITKIFDFDFATLVPELSGLLRDIRTALTLALLVGPIILLVLGAIYLLRPPAEANYRFGFRTYFGMGSVEAWRFSQKIAGMAFGGLGVVLLIVMIVVAVGLGKKDLYDAANTAIVCLLWQAGLALLARLVPSILAAVYFDGDGNRRR